MSLNDFATDILPLRPRIHAYARALLRADADAEDVTQEVLLRLWEQRAELSGIRNLLAFATRITRNLCIDRFRKTVASQPLESAPASSDDKPTPEEAYETRDSFQLVMALSRQLSAKQRQILLLRDAAGCSFEEIASITGLRPPNVRMHLSRARKRIRQLYEARQENE